MKKIIKGDVYNYHGRDGGISSGVYFKLETNEYVLPYTIKIIIDGMTVFPTAFDVLGNPRIDGIAYTMLVLNRRALIMEGLIEDCSQIFATCEYRTLLDYTIPLQDRIAKMNICPICGKEFKIDDLKDNLESYQNILLHKSCFRKFNTAKTFDDIVQHVHSGLSYEYNSLKWNKDISFKLIPNEYCKSDCCSHKPWIIFNTPYGQLKVGWRKRVISITFLKGFKTINFNEIFKNENVTKGNYKDGYNIHAWSYDDIYKYLQMAVNKIHEI